MPSFPDSGLRFQFTLNPCTKFFLNILMSFIFLKGLGLFHSVEEILQVPGIGRNLLEQNRDTLICTIPATPNSPQTSSLRRSVRRCPAVVAEAPKTKKDTMINSSDRELTQHRTSRSGANSSPASSAVNSSLGSRQHPYQNKEKIQGAGRGTKAMEVEDNNDDEEEEEEEEIRNGEEDSEEEKEEELLGLDFEEDKESDLKEIVYAIRRSSTTKAPSTHSEGSVGHFRNESSLMGSDTPHEEGGISDTPLDVPLSPMRITDGQVEIDNDEEEPEDLDGKAIQEEEMVVVEQLANSHQPDKKQVKLLL